MLLGAIGFALYIGYTTSILQSHNASKRLYAEKYSSIKQYMLFRKVKFTVKSIRVLKSNLASHGITTSYLGLLWKSVSRKDV